MGAMAVVVAVGSAWAGSWPSASSACRSEEVIYDFSGIEFPDPEWRRAPDEGPLEVIAAFYRAYERDDIDALAARMHMEYRFVSDDPDFTREFPLGLTREDEWGRVIASHEDAKRVGGGVTTRITHAGLELVGDPDSGRVEVVAHTPVLRQRRGAVELEASSARHRFLLVRPPKYLRDRGWRVLRWAEELGEPDTTGRDSLLAARAPLDPAPDEDLPRTLAFTRAGAEPGPALAFGVALPRAADVVVSLIDVQGRIHARHHAQSLVAGRHVVRLSGANASPGIYWARLQAGAERRQMRVTLVR